MSKSTLIHEVCPFLREEDGPTATEYAVILALIIVVALSSIGGARIEGFRHLHGSTHEDRPGGWRLEDRSFAVCVSANARSARANEVFPRSASTGG